MVLAADTAELSKRYLFTESEAAAAFILEEREEECGKFRSNVSKRKHCGVARVEPVVHSVGQFLRSIYHFDLSKYRSEITGKLSTGDLATQKPDITDVTAMKNTIGSKHLLDYANRPCA